MAVPTSPPAYISGIIPADPSNLSVFLSDELRKISHAVAAMNRLTPQASTEAPKVLVDGMQRLSRSPWWPAAGQVADAWVYYDAPTATWLFL